MDDFAGDNTTTGVLDFGGTTSGSIEIAGDIDWFAVGPTNGDTLRIAVPNDNVILRLVDQFGNVVATSEYDFNADEFVLLAQVDAGETLYVEVVGNFGATGDYTLTTTGREDDFLDNTNTSGLIVVDGVAVDGELNFDYDVDWVAINLTAGDIVEILSSNGDVGINLLDAFGNILSTGVDTGSSFLLTAQVETGGTYYIEASASITPPDTDAYTLTATLIDDGADDILVGTSGADSLFGQRGNDVLEGLGGADSLDGGAGVDTASYAGSTNRVIINMAANTATSGHATGDTLVSIENVIGSNFGDIITGDREDNVINGGDGADIVSGFIGDDTLNGGAGRDLLSGGAGADIIDGGDGNSDIARYAGSTAGVEVDLGAGTGFGGHAEGDILTNIEQVFGSSHADILTGNGQNNFVFGSGGDDILDGAGGFDKLFGGAGADTFVFGAGDQVIYIADWEDDIDSLNLSQYNFASVEDALANMNQFGNHVRFFSDGETVLILNADLGNMADDIIIEPLAI